MAKPEAEVTFTDLMRLADKYGITFVVGPKGKLTGTVTDKPRAEGTATVSADWLLLCGIVLNTIGTTYFAYHTGRLHGLRRAKAIHYAHWPECPAARAEQETEVGW